MPVHRTADLPGKTSDVGARRRLTPQPFQSAGNRILAALPAADLLRLAPHLSETALRLRQELFRAERPIQQVYFPDSGVCSVVSVMRSGASVEVATVGNEGLTGLALFFGEQVEPSSAVVQVPGRARVMPAQIFVEELERRTALHRLVGHYAHARTVQIMQAAACSRLHPMKSQTTKWLLKTHDRVVGNEFNLTQDLLSMMIGASRPRVSRISHALEVSGLIRCRHGKITILDRTGLEARSCECYEVERNYFHELEPRLPG